MKTILFLNRKGGSGKTTLLAHTAVQADQLGEKVTMLDLDTQQNLYAWWKDRKADTPQLLQVPNVTDRAHDPVPWLLEEIDRARQVDGLFMVDTPGWEAPQLRPLAEAADFIVIPVQPTKNDLVGVGSTVQLMKSIGRENYCFVVSRGREYFGQLHGMTTKGIVVLSQFGPVSGVILDRPDYASAMNDGRTIQEIDPKGRGTREVAALWTYIRNRLDGRTPDLAESHDVNEMKKAVNHV